MVFAVCNWTETSGACVAGQKHSETERRGPLVSELIKKALRLQFHDQNYLAIALEEQ